MRISHSRNGMTVLRRGALGTLAVAAIAAGQLAAAAVASAHVTVSAPGAAAGDWTVVTLKVPTESETATTTKVEVTLPEVTSARTVPVPGWTAQITKNNDGVATKILWTATPENKGIGADEIGLFPVSLGPLPEAASIEFPAVQTYSDGEVVTWADPPKADGTEAEHPAPTLDLLPAADADAAPGATSPSVSAAPASATNGADSTTTEAANEDGGSDNTARVLGGVGLVLGVAALAIALVRGRKQSS